MKKQLVIDASILFGLFVSYVLHKHDKTTEISIDCDTAHALLSNLKRHF